MKMRKFWKILLGVVIAFVVFGAVGFGFFRHSMWGGRYGAMMKIAYSNWHMTHDIDGDMPCEEEGETACEGSISSSGFDGCGMGRMPHMRGMRGSYGMHGSWGWRGHSPLTGLLLLTLVVMGVVHFKHRHMIHRFYHHGPSSMHSDVDGACCCGGEQEHVDKTATDDKSTGE